MKTPILILTFLALAIGLGGAYVFMPKEVAENDPDITISVRPSVQFLKEYPFYQVHQKMTVSYAGEGLVWMPAYGYPTEFKEQPASSSGGCVGPDYYLIESGNAITWTYDPAYEPDQYIYFTAIEAEDTHFQPMDFGQRKEVKFEALASH